MVIDTASEAALAVGSRPQLPSTHAELSRALLEYPHACWVASPTESDPREKAEQELKWLVLPNFFSHTSMSTII